MVTFLVALGSNLSALWILIANGWMQNPVGAEFNFETMRMEVTALPRSCSTRWRRPSSCTRSPPVTWRLRCSCWAYRRGTCCEAREPFRLALVRRRRGLRPRFGAVGDRPGRRVRLHDRRIAEGQARGDRGRMGDPEPPASFTAFGFPNQEAQRTDYAIKIPWLLGLIATRSVDTPSDRDQGAERGAQRRIRNGMIAYAKLQKLRRRPDAGSASGSTGTRTTSARAAAQEVHAERRRRHARADQGRGDDTIPNVAPMYWCFRIMVGLGVWFLFFFLRRVLLSSPAAIWRAALAAAARAVEHSAAMGRGGAGWIVAEYGRQPWTISGVLPTYLSVSSISWPATSTRASAASSRSTQGC